MILSGANALAMEKKIRYRFSAMHRIANLKFNQILKRQRKPLLPDGKLKSN